MNPILEGRKKLQILFDKIDFILSENFEVISKLLVPIEKKENNND